MGWPPDVDHGSEDKIKKEETMADQGPESPGVADSAGAERPAVPALWSDFEALWGAYGIVHRMETLSLSFTVRARLLRSVGDLNRAKEAEHAADMIRTVLTDFTHDYDQNRKL